MFKILDGKKLSKEIREELKKEIEEKITANKLPKPVLAIIKIGNDAGSEIYVKNKILACNEVGIETKLFEYQKLEQKDLNELILKLNRNNIITGILLQLPIPKNLKSNEALNLIEPQKDVDGLTILNQGKLQSGDATALASCTPQGVISLLKKYDINLDGKNACIINRSILVGKPLALLFLQENATVTICHSHTKNIESITKKSDVIVSAVGKRNFLTANMVKKNAVVIDIGTNRDENGKLCGDVDFENVKEKCSFITPVPGGIGPMTIAMLLTNVLKAYHNTNL